MLYETPIHDAFGLTYASWFVVPRVILQEMPVEWQKRFLELMDEMNQEFDWEPDCTMEIVFRKRGKYIKVPKYYRNYRRPDFGWLELIKERGKNAKKA